MLKSRGAVGGPENSFNNYGDADKYKYGSIGIFNENVDKMR